MKIKDKEKVWITPDTFRYKGEKRVMFMDSRGNIKPVKEIKCE